MDRTSLGKEPARRNVKNKAVVQGLNVREVSSVEGLITKAIKIGSSLHRPIRITVKAKSQVNNLRYITAP